MASLGPSARTHVQQSPSGCLVPYSSGYLHELKVLVSQNAYDLRNRGQLGAPGQHRRQRLPHALTAAKFTVLKLSCANLASYILSKGSLLRKGQVIDFILDDK